MHAYGAMQFQGKDIPVVGTSHSTEDIGIQCWKYGCNSVTVAHPTAAMGYDWPANRQDVLLLSHVDTDTACFIDGTSKKVAAIIL